MTKSELRKIFKRKRNTLSQDEVAVRSEQITKNFLKNLLPKFSTANQQIFSLYLASKNEVSTDLIAEYFIKNQINFSYPKIVATDQPLDFIKHHQQMIFSASKFYANIPEPENGEKVLPNLLLIPLLAFDSNLSRLGMGGGFFDRTIAALKMQKSQITTIGLAFDFQESKESLPLEDTDCTLDFIVTEKKVFSPSHD